MNIKDSLKFGVMIGLLEVHKVVVIYVDVFIDLDNSLILIYFDFDISLVSSNCITLV